MPDWDSLLNSKFIYLVLGLIFLSAAVTSACTGKTIARYRGWVYRDKNPSDFWWVVAIYWLAGMLGIGIYLGSVFPEAIFHPERWLQLM
jgi:hypothetical protein